MNCRRKRSFFFPTDFAAETARLRGRTRTRRCDEKRRDFNYFQRLGFADMLLLLITERNSFPMNIDEGGEKFLFRFLADRVTSRSTSCTAFEFILVEIQFVVTLFLYIFNVFIVSMLI